MYLKIMKVWAAVCRDELTSERDIESTYYLYEKGGMLFGHYTEGTWYFGLKVDTWIQIYAVLIIYWLWGWGLG